MNRSHSLESMKSWAALKTMNSYRFKVNPHALYIPALHQCIIWMWAYAYAFYKSILASVRIFSMQNLDHTLDSSIGDKNNRVTKMQIIPIACASTVGVFLPPWSFFPWTVSSTNSHCYTLSSNLGYFIFSQDCILGSSSFAQLPRWEIPLKF